MATPVPNYNDAIEVVPTRPAFSWSGIFAGAFLYLVIEATFGTLGAAVFASNVNTNAVHKVGFSMAAGIGIWMIILSGIAMYFAGRLAARVGGATTRAAGMRAGLVTFGLSIFSTILIIAITLSSSMASTTGLANAGPSSVAALLTIAGYWIFGTLIVCMFTSAFGGAHGAGVYRAQAPVAKSTTRMAA